MCAGALRAYLIERDALPDTPLVAMVPVSLRAEDEQDCGGNMVGTILCNLATDTDDPAKRLDAISTSMRDNKKVFAELPEDAGAGVVGVPDVAASALTVVPGVRVIAPPPFNIVISNVPARANRCTGTAPDSTATTRCRSRWTVRP